WEMVRSADPKDDEPYITLFHIYYKLRQKDDALVVLNAAVAQLPGTEVARRAKSLLDELAEHPERWNDSGDGASDQEKLVRRLDSTDPAVVQKTLEDMRAFKWPALPSKTYQVLLK